MRNGHALRFTKGRRRNVLVVRNLFFGSFGFFCWFFFAFLPICLLDPSFKLVGSVLEKPHWVVFLIFINPLPILILIFLKVLNFNRRTVHGWLLVVCRQVGLPIGIHKVVAESHESMDLSIRPFVQVDWFDLCDMCSELSMHAYINKVTRVINYCYNFTKLLTWTSQTNETPESDWCPTRCFVGAIRTNRILLGLEKGFKNFDLLV